MRIASALLLLFTASIACAAETETMYLSGRGSDDAQPWDFFCSAGRNSGVWTKIAVPSCWELQGFGAYEYGVESRPSKRMPVMLPAPAETGIYRRQFVLPAGWQGRVVKIAFEGVMTDAEVKINGVPAGPVHQGGFYPFQYDITDKLRFDGPNDIEVSVSKRSANASVNRAERIGDYWNFGGIFRPVRLEAMPPAFIDRVAIDAKADGAFTSEIYLGGSLPGQNEIVAQVKTLDGQNVGEPIAMAVPAGARQVRVEGRIPAPKTWTAETPNLYRAEFTLRTGGTVAATHAVSQRFGFRTFEVRTGDGLYLNGQKITMKGVCRHSFWPETGRTLSLERQREDIRLMKEANLNAVRMSHYPPDAEFLDLCDEAGLYVLDELGGWQGSYDTPTGRKLIAEMVARDVNHPSILFWDNGNEGGENEENDDQFTLHDPQHRPVLHPWAVSFRGMNTKHYRDYADTAKYVEGPDIFMPTEFLHGLYDGGHAAGLDDYWKLMGEKPHAAGGFLWVWADEAVVRTDENGRLDARRDLGPDGIVGPHHEKEGSFNAIREIWSPIQIPLSSLPADFAGVLPVRNRYDFQNLNGVTFEWKLMRFAPPGALLFHRTLLSHGRVTGSDLAPRTDGELKLPLPADWRQADALYVTAYDSQAREIWTWSWNWKTGLDAIGRTSEATSKVSSAEEGNQIVATVGRTTVRFNKATGLLAGLERDGHLLSLANGPRLVAYRRVERSFEPVAAAAGKLQSIETKRAGDSVVVRSVYDGPFRHIQWTVQPDGDVRLDYALDGPGVIDILGIDFDYPEEKMKSKEWLGGGPYRVWQNRLKGVQFFRWDTPYNDPIPGQSWDYPEFKGWFSDWRWMAFTTTEGRFAFLNASGHAYVGAYSPRDGKNNPVLALPRLGLGVYQAITGIGSKTARPDQTGPQGQSQNITGVVEGALVIRLLDQP